MRTPATETAHGAFFLGAARRGSFADAEERGDFELAFDAAPEAMWIYDVETQHFLAFNGAARRRFGYTAEEIGDVTVADLLVSEEGTGARGWGDLEGVRLHRARDGTTFPAIVSTSAVSFAGTLARMIVVSEIPAELRAEGDRAHLAEELRLVLESSGEGIYSIDEAGICTFANPAAARMTGFEVAEFLGRNAHDLLHHTRPDGGHYEVRDCPIYEVLQTGRASRVDGEILWRSDGTQLPVTYSSHPIRVNGRVTGAVVTFSDTSERRALEKRLEEANEQLVHRSAELERRYGEVKLINDMGDLLQSASTTAEAYEVASRFGERLFPGTFGALAMFDPSRDWVEVVGQWGPSDVGPASFEPATCWALRRGRVHSSATGGATCAHVDGRAAGASLCVPMIAHGTSVGVLTIASADPLAAIDSRSGGAELATAVAANVALALTNFALRESLREQSIRDPLTNLFNRRYLDETLEREAARAERGAYPVAILQIDIDHFKAINDAFGHEAGDAVLAAFAHVLTSSFRGHDVACRAGGEEFAVVVPGATAETASARAEALRRALVPTKVAWQDTELAMPTVSIGVGVYRAGGPSMHEVVRAADAALYAAKGSGRDRVIVGE